MSDEPTGTNAAGEAPVAERVVETDEVTITDDADRVAAASVGPVLVVRGDRGDE